MQQIAGWLEKLGLGQYAPRFAENDINFAILSDLTDQDLKELGVSSLGHRRQLLRAIVELNTVEKGAPKFAPETAAPVTPQPQNAAERRQLTVMFVDLVGSTVLSARLDPEDMREIIVAYHRSCAEQIAKAGGFVAKYMGDGVLAYFGYPQAHEHDAERAVFAGLAVVEAAPKLKTAAGTPLEVRVGIATGLVVVGDLIGSGEAQERGVVGDTPNLAARLQTLAEPNMVVIADSTRRLLGNLFELKDLGPRDLKGIAGPARAWAALRASSAEGRFEALHTAGLTALVGREEELELLLRRSSRAKRGEGQVVLLSGEAGIGKSRLTAAVLERLATEPHTRLRYFCSPQHTDSAFYPIIGQMERAAGMAHDDKPQAKLDKLDAVLAQTSTPTEDAALFAEMLSLPNDGRYPALDSAPEQRRQRTLEALTSQLAELARQQPVLMIFEDAHWVDPTSLEVLGRTVDRIRTLPTLLIVTSRPEFNAPWVGQSHVTSLTLNRLGEREAAGIIARLVGNKALPADVLAEIVERTDGIPLFVEEMTKAVLEAESEGKHRPSALVADRPCHPRQAVPSLA
jgi:class 3 adenylate cyclase